jgi:hypothetical protein
MGKKAAIEERKKILLGELFLANKESPVMRIAGSDALRVWGLGSADIVKALFHVARTDSEEEVWRAAVTALKVVARIDSIVLMLYPPGIKKAERLSKLKVWEGEWKIRHKEAAAETE